MTAAMGAAELFDRHRPLLFSIAYRMLGSATDAEDVVQEAFVRWLQAGDALESPKAYLSTVVTHLCIDQLRSARARREAYVGPWLPEPISTADRPELVETVVQAESLSFAFLVLLERLSPVERAVLVLRDVFEYDYAEIARIVGKSEANCRQILHRARARLGDRPHVDASYADRRRIAEELVHAATDGDVDRLIGLLAEDVVFTGDAGGKARTALQPVRGAERVARGALGGMRWLPPGAEAGIVEVNGGPAILIHVAGQPVQLVVLTVAGGRVSRVDDVLNPDKLRRVRLEPAPSGTPVG